MRCASATASLAISLVLGTSALAEDTVHDFEEYTVGEVFAGVEGEYSASKSDGSSITIADRTGTFNPEIEGLGGNTMWTGPPTGDFEFVFDSPVDYFELYVLDAEDGEISGVSIETDTGLVGTITLIGTGVGEWCGPGSSCGGPVRLLQVGSRGGAVFSSVLIRSREGGPGPYDLLTFSTPTRVVTVNVNPRNNRACLNQHPVIVFGSADFDVTEVNPDTLVFGSQESTNNTPLCSLDYVNDDEHLDLACRFVPGTGEATLSGEMLDGTPFQGTDTICAAQ
jgi:hypothetical protein